MFGTARGALLSALTLGALLGVAVVMARARTPDTGARCGALDADVAGGATARELCDSATGGGATAGAASATPLGERAALPSGFAT